MAMCVSSIVKRGCNLLAKNGLRQLMFNATRTLYTPNSMGMHGYLNARDYVKSQFVNVDHLFFQKMRDFVDKEDEAMIFTEDLKTMLHLVEKKPEDLDLLYKMMKKYNLQNNLRFGSFVFGTVVMRTFYHLDEPDLALKAFKDPELANFFDQIITYQLLMDMLYNHGRYADVRDVYNIVKTKNVYGIANPKNPFILVMGACYKENTKESLEYAVQLFKEGQEKGFDFPRRAITFLAGLALKQDAPEIALEAASLARNVRYIDIRCIKVEAYVALNRIDEVMVYFRNTLQNDLPNRRKQCYFKDTIEKVQALVEKLELDETSDLVKILNQIKLHDYIQPTTLEEHLCSTIDQIKNVEQKPWERRDGNRQAQATRYSDRFQNQHQYDRPGLKNQI